MTHRDLRRTWLLPVLATLAGAACDLTLTNPNAPPEQTVLNTPDGLVALAVGMQSQYAGAVADFLVPPSLMTDEWGTTSKSLIASRRSMHFASIPRRSGDGAPVAQRAVRFSRAGRRATVTDESG